MDLDADRVAAARGVGEEDGSATGWDNFLENQLGFYIGTERLPGNQLLEKKFLRIWSRIDGSVYHLTRTYLTQLSHT
jgi:hypothetical protein